MALKLFANQLRLAGGRQSMTKVFAKSTMKPFECQVAHMSALNISSRKVLIPTRLDPAAKELLEQNNYEVVMDAETPIADLIEQHSDSFAIIVRSEKVDKDLMAKMKNLKIVVRAGAGFNTIDTKGARKLGVDVMNTPGANANAVAEEVVAMALAAFRHVVAADISTRAGKWEKKKFMGREVTGKTVGILGLGNIGQLIVERLKGFKCEILANDPFVSASKAESMGVSLTSVEDIFAKCDIITLHIPENDATRKMVNEKLFSSMKEGAVLINCARQGVVDEDALKKAKETKDIKYCTDVYVKDEAGDKPIKEVADIMLPHIGANTKEANYTAAVRAASQIVGYVDQGVSSYIVNRATPQGLNPLYQKLGFFLGKVANAWAGHQPHTLETSIYGDIHKFSKYILPPVVLGMSQDFDPTWAYEDCLKYLDKQGVSLTDRDVDDTKGYGSSLTVDLLSGKEKEYNKVSIRGTITEGLPMIARIDDFDGVYFNPIGHSLMIRYPDRPGQLARITKFLSKSHVNILDIRCPQNKAGKSLAIISLDDKISDEVLADIEDITDADRCVQLYIK
jgi:D-3-phosphoglycerate dehydrogenase